jgi:beta-lactamase class D
MKLIIYTLTILSLVSCQSSNDNIDTVNEEFIEIREVTPELQNIVDSANVRGSILIFDPNNNIYYSNNFKRASTSFIPASTFKIPNSIVALELGNAIDENTILKWDGTVRNNDNWNQDLTLANAYKYSCVPCYQELARKAGVDSMKNQLEKIQYPGMLFDSSSLDLFWLQGESRISQMEQISFLQKLKNEELRIKSNTYTAMKKIMLFDKTDDYSIYAKTGMAIRDTVTYGWFVGFVEKGEHTYYFATNIAPGTGMDLWGDFVPARIDVTFNALKALNCLEMH